MSDAPSTIPHGNIRGNWVLSITISPSSIAPSTTAEQTFTVNGLQLGDYVEVNKPSAQAGLAIGNTRVSALNTLAILFINATAATITPTASEAYQLCVTRADNLTTAGAAVLTTVP